MENNSGTLRTAMNARASHSNKIINLSRDALNTSIVLRATDYFMIYTQSKKNFDVLVDDLNLNLVDENVEDYPSETRRNATTVNYFRSSTR